MKLSSVRLGKVPVVGVALAGLFATAITVAPAALADTPAWEPDINGNGGSISFYDAAGHQVTAGTDLSHLFDYAVASSAEQTGLGRFHKASLTFAFPDHTQPTSAWFVNGQTAATTYPLASAPGDLATVPASTPVASPDATEMNLTAALGGGVQDSTAGYANIIQIRMKQSGSTASYWSADISFDTNAGTWTEIYPASSSAVSTTTTLAASPAGSQTGGSPVTLTATVTPSGAAGTVQFKDGATNVGSPVTVAAGTAQLVTSSLAAGTHSLTAAFSPTDPTAFAASSSAAVSYSVLDPTSISISKSTTVKYGSATTTSTTVTDTRTAHGLAGVPVKLYRRSPSSSTWVLVGTVTTSSTGKAAKSVAPLAKTVYQWRYAGNSAHKPATSASQTVSVAQVVAIHATKTSVRHGSTIKIYGTVKPSSSGAKVYLQKLSGRTWKNGPSVTIKRQKLPNGVTTTGYVFSVKLSTTGSFHYRVYKPATSTLVAGYSSSLTVRAT